MTIQAIFPAGIPSAPPAGGQTAPVPTEPSASQPRLPGAERPTGQSAAVQANAKPEEVRNAVEKVKEFVSPVTSDIQFSIDEDTDATVVKIIDRSTKEVIRQIPSQEMLEIAKALDRLQGLLIRQKA